MFHPSILAAYLYRRNECQELAIDACMDTAEHEAVCASQLARFLITMGIDAGQSHRLFLLA